MGKFIKGFFLLSLGLLVFSNCTKDPLKKMDSNTNAFYLLRVGNFLSQNTTTENTDSTIPSVPEGKNLKVQKVSFNSIQISWDKSNDDFTSENKLIYSIYLSESNKLETFEDIKNSGIQVFHGTTTDYLFKITSLKKNSKYFINLLVEDEAGNVSIYTPIEQLTLNEGIHFFASKKTDGNLGSRENANLICSQSFTNDFENSIFECNQIIAFISMNSNDEVRDMSTNYGLPLTIPFYGIQSDGSQTLIADNYDHAINQTNSYNLYHSLTEVMNIIDSDWWSGTTFYGNYISSCNDFTINSSGFYGQTGNTLDKNEQWLVGGGNDNCNNLHPLVCACY